MSKLTELAACVEAGGVADVVALTKAALDEGNAPLDVLNTGLVEPINVLGEKFRTGGRRRRDSPPALGQCRRQPFGLVTGLVVERRRDSKSVIGIALLAFHAAQCGLTRFPGV